MASPNGQERKRNRSEEEEKFNLKALDDRDFIEISKLIGEPNVWKKVARQLGVKERHIRDIDNKDEDSEEKAYQMLMKWKESHPDQCTLQNLCTALRKEEFNDKADHLLDKETVRWKDAGPIPTVCNRRPSSEPKWKKDLQSRLKEFYRKFTLPRLPWVEEGSDVTVKDYYSKLQLFSTEQQIAIEDIFTYSKEPVKRILIEGQPGFGKTTLMTKLAYDWAVGEEYMQKFGLVFIIMLKQMQGKDIPSAICEISNYYGFSDKILLNELTRKADDVLLLLDGFDEIPQSVSRTSTLEVLHKRLYPDATVAVTCRNGMLQTKREDPIDCSITPPSETTFWNEKIEVIGLAEDGLDKLLRKILSETQTKDLVQKLTSSDCKVIDICKSPLIVMLLGHLYAYGDIIEYSSTRTKLYKNILSGLAKYSLVRRKEIVETDFCLFSGRSKLFDSWKGKLSEFGKNCFEMIKTSSELLFEDSVLTREIYPLGFLNKNQNCNIFKKVNYFEPLHRSFVEFFAAFYAAQQYSQPEDDENDLDGLTDDLHEIHFSSRGTSLILPFTAGLMGYKANSLLSRLQPNAWAYHNRTDLLWNIVEECEHDERLCKSIVPLLPTVLHSSIDLDKPQFLPLNFFKGLINEWMNKNDCPSVVFSRHKKLQSHLFRGELHTIIFEMEDLCFTQEEFVLYCATLSQVTCFRLVFDFDGFSTDKMQNSKLLGEWLSLKEKLNAQQLLLKNCDELVCEMLMSIEKLPENIFLLQCTLIIGRDNLNLFLNHLMINSKVHMLHLNWRYFPLPNVLTVSPLIASQWLRSVSIWNDPFDCECEIDLNVLTNLSDKILDYLSLRWITLTCNDSKMTEIKVNTFETFFCTFATNVVSILLNSNILALKCTDNFILEFLSLQSNADYPIYNSVTDLHVKMQRDVDEKFWKYLTNFRKSNTLILKLPSFEKGISECAIEALQSMQLKYLQFQVLDMEEKSNLFERLKLFSRRKKTESSNPQISVVIKAWFSSEDTKQEDNFIELVGLLDNGMLHEIVIETFHSVPESWINRKNFEVKYDHFIPQNHSIDFVGLHSSKCEIGDLLTITKRQPIS